MKRFSALLVLLAASALPAGAAAPDPGSRLRKGQKLLRAARTMDRAILRVRAERRAKWYLYAARRLANLQKKPVIAHKATKTLVEVLNRETAFDYIRGSLVRAQRHNAEALILLPNDHRALALSRAIVQALQIDVYEDAGSQQINRLRDRRPIRDRGLARRR